MAACNYETITAKFANHLQAVVDGTETKLPWQRDWRLLGAPRNGFSARRYTGLNVMLLSMTGFSDPRWATRAQIMKFLGYTKGAGKFGKWLDKKGNPAPKGIFPEYDANDPEASPTTITFWKFMKVEDKTARNPDGTPVEKTIPLLKVFSVYNFEQIGWPEGRKPKLDLGTTEPVDVVHEKAEAVFSRYLEEQGIKVSHRGDRAVYKIMTDEVVLPATDLFTTQEGYVATKAHELIHSTGAKGRLNRNLTGSFGTPDYAREELVAELGAAFLCSDLGITGASLDDAHKAYIVNWISALKNNKYEIFTAARLAREAAAMVGGVKEDATEDANEESEAA